MTEAEWRSTDDWRAMLAWLTVRSGSTRKWTLYLCAGLRQIWDRWLYSDHSRNAVEVAERAADGLATRDESGLAGHLAEIPTFGSDFEPQRVLVEDPGRRFSDDFSRLIEWGVIRADEIGLGDRPNRHPHRSPGRRLAMDDDDQHAIESLVSRKQLGSGELRAQLMRAAWTAMVAAGVNYTASETVELSEHSCRNLMEQRDWPGAWLLREVFGNPFAPAVLELAWRTETAIGLATGIYDDKAFERLPILADALEEAGCDNPDILSHCREPGLHVRGCWVVDLVLGKE